MMLAHSSHSLEVLMAYWVTTRIWWLYHSQANSPMLRAEGEDIWWGRLVSFMEKGWDGPVPDKPGCPLPVAWREKMRICFGVFNNVHTM